MSLREVFSCLGKRFERKLSNVRICLEKISLSLLFILIFSVRKSLANLLVTMQQSLSNFHHRSTFYFHKKMCRPLALGYSLWIGVEFDARACGAALCVRTTCAIFPIFGNNRIGPVSAPEERNLVIARVVERRAGCTSRGCSQSKRRERSRDGTTAKLENGRPAG